MPPGAWPRAARPGADRFFQPFGDIWQLLKEAAAPAAFHPPPRALRSAQTPPHLLPGLRRGWGPPGGRAEPWWGTAGGPSRASNAGVESRVRPESGLAKPQNPGEGAGVILGAAHPCARHPDGSDILGSHLAAPKALGAGDGWLYPAPSTLHPGPGGCQRPVGLGRATHACPKSRWEPRGRAGHAARAARRPPACPTGLFLTGPSNWFTWWCQGRGIRGMW